MKKLILLFVIMISYQFVFGSTLVVKFPKGKFKVVLDGSVYWASQDLRFNQIYPGTKSITIIRESRNNYGQYTYRTVYDGLINVPRKSNVTANYCRGYMNISTVSMRGYNDLCGQCGNRHDGQSCNSGYSEQGNQYGASCGNDRAGNRNNRQAHACGNCGNYHNGGACSERRNGHNNSGAILELMRNESFDSDRLALGMSYVKGHRASAQEIKQMALAFTFDSNRLTFAKKAYAFCANPQDYYLVSTTFTFSSSKRELLSYIG